MNPDQVLRVLEEIAAGRTTPEAALDRLAWMPVEPLGDGDGPAFARIDHHRALRNGMPEVVFCPGKSAAQVVRICEQLARASGGFLATRADDTTRQALADRFADAQIDETARTVWLAPEDREEPQGAFVLVVSAGTADLPVAEEAAVAAYALGCPVRRLYDVGVAGLHRLLVESRTLAQASAVIVVAGMEGALPSVVGGLVSSPVIAVPTSVGYGASFGGVAALLAMLNSCAAGVTVVNIDNGFGAACAAARIRNTRQSAGRTDVPVETLASGASRSDTE